MLRSLVESSLRWRVVVVTLAALVLVHGARVAVDAPLDVFPEFAPPQVVVQTEAPGFSAEQVETLVTRPVEVALSGSVGLEALRSQSIQGLSVVTAVFAEGVEPQRARQVLSERLGEVAPNLPAGAAAPKLTPLTSATLDLLKIGLVSEQCSPMELRRFAQWTLRPRLLGVAGVAGVSLFGGEIEQLQIQVDPARLARAGLSLADVLAAARAATGVLGAGFVEGPNQRVVLEGRGQFSTPEELERVVLARRAGHTLLLSDVARVVLGPEPLFGDTLIQGRPGVLLTMLSQYGSNTYEVTQRVEAALEELAPLIRERGIQLYPRLHRPATFIENSLANLRESLLIGAVLVAVVLFLFLLDLRTAFISLTAIPLSLGAALIVMDAAGQTLNTITLGGLAIALGEVVDDAIIDVENILRRLRENAAAGHPKSSFKTVLEASLEVRGAIVYATLVVALVFVPVLTLSGLQGKLFAPLAQVYLLAILASLGVALTVTPALSLLLLSRSPAEARELALLGRAREFHARLVTALARRPWPAAGFLAALFVAALVARTQLTFEFLPAFREGHFVLQASAAPGTSLEEMKRVGARLSQALLANPHIATVEQQIGRAELGEDPWGPNRSEFHVELVPLAPEVEALVEDEIRATLEAEPGLRTEVLTFLGDRIGETISGDASEIVISLYGEDLDALERAAERLAAELATLDGAVDVQPSSAPASPALEIVPRAGDLARLGLRPLDVLEAVQIAFQGVRAAETWEHERLREVVVVLAPEARGSPEAVAALPLGTPDGGSVPLSAVADVRGAESRALVLHEGARRRATITCNVAGRDANALLDEARTRLARIPLPPGTYLSFGGSAAAEGAARRELLLHSALALAGIVLVAWMAFESLSCLVLLFLNLPFALVGGVFAALLAGSALSLGSLVGFVTVFGITTRNSIMLLSHYQHLVRVEGCSWNLATAVRGARERFVPVTMTALVTGLGLLPLALQAGAAGREIEGPMATVILGGLVTSTLLNLLFLPGFALRFADPRGRTKAEDGEPAREPG